MPNPFSRIIPDAELYLDPNILDNKPEMAATVARIFAVWASIEHRLRFLLIEVVGSGARSAIAIYETLTSQQLQLKALDNAAKSVLSLESYSVLLTAMSLAEGSATPRNHLAHWMWGGCKQRPDLLALADPFLMKELDLRMQVFSEANGMVECDGWDPEFLDPDFVLGYSLGDLGRAHRDLIAANEALDLVGSCIFFDGVRNRRHQDPDEKARILAQLNESPSFRAAKVRIDAALKTHPPDPYAPLRSKWSR